MIVATFLLAFFAPGISPNLLAQEQLRPFRIQCNLPLTGELATYGNAIEEGVRFAVSEISSKERDLVKFDWQDNQSAAKQAVTIQQRHLANAGDVYISGVRPQTMAIWKTTQGTAYRTAGRTMMF